MPRQCGVPVAQAVEIMYLSFDVPPGAVESQAVVDMRSGKWIGAVAAVALLGSCGGDSGGGSNGAVGGTAATPAPTPSPSPGPTVAAGCSLAERQAWAKAQLDEWYLFPESLATGVNPGAYASVDAYIDALTAPARAQSKDRYFTYLTSIASENAYYSSGASAGFGVRLSYDFVGRQLFVAEAFEGAPALAAGIDRGTRILAIGTDVPSLRDVTGLLANGNGDAVVDALGPSTVGTTRLLRVADATQPGGYRDVVVAKADYALLPVSTRYGYKIIDDDGRRVGYVNLRTFITTADDQLRTAFAAFRQQGVTEVIVDLRYNGGGLVSTAELFSDLLGGNRSSSDVQSYTTFRPSKASNNETRFFSPKNQSIASTKIAFIGTGGTASASEYVINAFVPYLHANAALVGTNTYGKPVGQIPLDKAACDDRLRVVAFALQNAARQGDYYTGLAPKVEATCQAADDLSHPLGDPAEGSTRAALDFLAGRSCTKIATTATAQRAGRVLLTPARPDTMQREVPGSF